MNATNKTANVLIPPSRFVGGACAPGASSRRKAANGPENVRGVTRSGARAILILAAAAVAAVGPALSGRAQGSIELDNSQSSGRVVLGAPGNYYDYGGVYGVEVWMLNTSRLPPGINGAGPVGGYGSLQTDFFTREATFADQNNSSTPGVIRLGELDMRTVAPYGATVVIALAMWDNAAPSFSAGVFNELPPGNGGVLAFVNPTADYTAVPTPVPPALSGWTSDLVMLNPIPEPSAFTLAGLGATAWLLLRRSSRSRSGRRSLQ